jgi:hypothetical protein
MVAGNFASAVYSIRQDVTVKLLDQATIIDPVTHSVLYSLAQQDMIAIRAVMRMGWALPNPATRLDPERLNVPFAYIEPMAENPAVLHTVTYTVNDDGGLPIAGATVNIGGARKKTGADGRSAFSLYDGSYAVRVSKNGYSTKNDSVLIAGADTEQTVRLKTTVR